MSEQQLTDMTVLSMERDLSDKISFDEIIHLFVGDDKNRIIIS